MRYVYRLSHDVHLARVCALILCLELADLQPVVFPQHDPRVLPYDEVTSGEHPALPLPHEHKLAQVCHLTGQHEGIAEFCAKQLVVGDDLGSDGGRGGVVAAPVAGVGVVVQGRRRT